MNFIILGIVVVSLMSIQAVLSESLRPSDAVQLRNLESISTEKRYPGAYLSAMKGKEFQKAALRKLLKAFAKGKRSFPEVSYTDPSVAGTSNLESEDFILLFGKISDIITYLDKETNFQEDLSEPAFHS